MNNCPTHVIVNVKVPFADLTLQFDVSQVCCGTTLVISLAVAVAMIVKY